MTRTDKQLREDLQALIRGDLHLTETERQLYATDASLFRVEPLGVVAPRDEEDIVRLVGYAREHGISLTARGGGTGLAGESLSAGLIVDLSRHFDRILHLEEGTVRVQAGVVAQVLNQALFPLGRRIAIDSASLSSCTVGGMAATNASGARLLKYGYLRRYVRSLRTILASGQDTLLAPTRLVPFAERQDGSLEQLAARLERLIDANSALIVEKQPAGAFNRCGYLLNDLVEDGKVALHRAPIGAEGTLGITTEIELETVPIPSERVVLLLGFATIRQAAEAAPVLIPSSPSAIELIDRRLLALACEADSEFKRLLSPAVQAALLVEWEGFEAGEALSAAKAALGLIRQNAQILSERICLNETDASWIWSVRDRALPAMRAMMQKALPVAFVEDIGVPVESLGIFLDTVQHLLHKHSTSASILSHAGAGVVHLLPLFDLNEPDGAQRLKAFAEDVYAEVFKLKGTISAQHGVGLARTPWLAHQYGPLAAVFRQVKDLFDPAGLFNPGKIAGKGEEPLGHLRRPSRLALPLDKGVKRESALSANGQVAAESQAEHNGTAVNGQSPPIELPTIAWHLNWPRESPLAEAQRCHGCGGCRTRAAERRMCPIFRAQGVEAASPRAKANLLRELLDRRQSPGPLMSPATREVADLCVNCKMCAVECPSHVDIPKLMLEAKAQHVTEHGLRWSDWVISLTDTWASLGSAWAWLANPLMRSGWFRWTLEKVLGVARKRRWPRFAAESFLSRAKRLGWTQPTSVVDRPRVVYFPDTYANYNDPDLGEASVRVLKAAGVEVFVPPERLVSGAASLSVGHVTRTRRIAQRNINTLAALARDGYTIICSEPTAAVMLRQDYLNLMDDPGAQQVARHTVELTSYLRSLEDQGRLPSVARHPLAGRIAHHVPCHMKALQQGIHGPDLLRRSSLSVETIDVSCSGMAGVYGLQHEHYDTSLAAGKPMLDRFTQEEFRFGSSECSSCRMQMEHVGKKPVLHPVQYLALMYGLMPELERRLEG